jgi:uncharacterized protein YhbP (UPF0306 family)
MEMDVEKLIREYLPDVIHMSLGTCRDNQPWVCEVHFAYDEDLNLYFRSLTSRRHSQEIADNTKVAGNIVKQVALDEFCKGVINFEGTAKLLQPGEEQNKAFTCIVNRLHLKDSILDDAKNPDGHQFYKITVNKWSIFGKFTDEGAQKYELEWNKS